MPPFALNNEAAVAKEEFLDENYMTEKYVYYYCLQQLEKISLYVSVAFMK